MSSESGSPTVSVIIPCYNARNWVAEAIHSCFNQTYPFIEVIVVDDGSTDGSLAVLEGFGSRITLKAGPNQGGNVARNAGFKLSSGDYIQFLDADDYLLPDKIAKQVHFLQETNADVVYGDWRFQVHQPNGHIYLEKIAISGAPADILESLLDGWWWVAPGALLYKRSVVNKVGGWDERLRAAQDRDFFTSVAMSGAVVRYLPGCDFIYRRHGQGTVSTSNIQRWLENHWRSLQKTESVLFETGRLSSKYKEAIAGGCFHLLRTSPSMNTELHFEILQKIQSLAPDFRAERETILFKLAQSCLGFDRTFRLFFSIRERVKSILKKTGLFGVVLVLRRLQGRLVKPIGRA